MHSFSELPDEPKHFVNFPLTDHVGGGRARQKLLRGKYPFPCFIGLI